MAVGGLLLEVRFGCPGKGPGIRLRVQAGVMDVNTEVLIVDRPRAEAVPGGDRTELLVDAASGQAYVEDLFAHGWSCPTQPARSPGRSTQTN
ncbi:hypothetical protein [Streptomyces sp. NPDC005731]|uniref:hypothetical protein n=1 Tax=Streptomyces sp. NPDC005731 TaxID=3157056 RepID=UPI0033E9AEC4